MIGVIVMGHSIISRRQDGFCPRDSKREFGVEVFLEPIKTQYPGYEPIVVGDGAGFHPKAAFHEMIPEGIHIVTLPPYSSELNPIENLGPNTRPDCQAKLGSEQLSALDTVVGLAFENGHFWTLAGSPMHSYQSLFGKGLIRSSANAT